MVNESNCNGKNTQVNFQVNLKTTIFRGLLTCHRKEEELNVIMKQVDDDGRLNAGESELKRDADLFQNFPDD